MIKHLSVRNYTLIDELEVDFNKGFSVITGETGSGKSIILGALGLLMGDRADLKALKDPEKKCIVEGVFQLTNDDLRQYFEVNDLDYDSFTVIRRELLPSGKSRAFVNDTPVNLNLLKELGQELLDIHSQHETILLGKNTFQFDVLDAASSSGLIKKEYFRLYKEYKDLEKELSELKEKHELVIVDAPPLSAYRQRRSHAD